MSTSFAPTTLVTIRDLAQKTSERLTTGDAVLDDLLSGGIRPGVITELVGESASGKTQLALQLSLCVQLPIENGGLSGSSCYLTTKGTLQTSRLTEISQNHKSPTLDSCSLDDIHTRLASSAPELNHILSQGIPKLMELLADKRNKPLKLVVLDSIGAIFRSDTKTSDKTLFDRSRDIIETASILHHLASSYHLAILAINDVNAATLSPDMTMERNSDHQLSYSQQARWFARGDSVSGEMLLEAGLGLTWANQVGIRIMMARTRRRRYIDFPGATMDKRRNADTVNENLRETPASEAMLIRRFSVLFSSYSPPGWVDFVIVQSGVVCIT